MTRPGDVPATLSREAVEAAGGIEVAERFINAELAKALRAYLAGEVDALAREMIEGTGGVSVGFRVCGRVEYE